MSPCYVVNRRNVKTQIACYGGPFLVLSAPELLAGAISYLGNLHLSLWHACMPSDLSAGTSAEIERERRLLYVAMTRAKDDPHLVVPQRFFVHGQDAQGIATSMPLGRASFPRNSGPVRAHGLASYAGRYCSTCGQPRIQRGYRRLPARNVAIDRGAPREHNF